MGQTTSVNQVPARLTVPAAAHRLQEIRFTYGRITCWGIRKKTIAVFTFPSDGWHMLPSGAFGNASVKAASIRLDSLQRKTSDTPVVMTGLANGVKVLKVPLLLGDFLEALSSGPRGGWVSSLDITLKLMPVFRGKGMHTAPSSAGPGLPCTNIYVLYCNDRLCGEIDADVLGYER